MRTRRCVGRPWRYWCNPAYLANTSDYPPQSDPCSNDLVTTTVHPNDSTDSDVDFVDSGARRFGLRRCALGRKRAKIKKIKKNISGGWIPGIRELEGPSNLALLLWITLYVQMGIIDKEEKEDMEL